MKRSHIVHIAGQELSIRSEEGPHYVEQLARYLDEQIRTFVDVRRTIPLQRVALLVALQLTDELFRERDLHQKYRKSVEAQLGKLEAAIAEHEKLVQALNPGDNQ